MPSQTVCFFRSGDAIRSRSVGDVVLFGNVDIPAPPARLVADWQRETTLRLALDVGDVEELPLARARARWPQYRRCVQAVSDWIQTVGLSEILISSDVALMAARGARYHHDAAQYGGMAFCNLFLSEDRGLDVHFPATGHRIPLTCGTVLVFDTCQPHAVIPRHCKTFDVADFPVGADWTQVFLTWEVPIENPLVAHALRIAFDVDTPAAQLLDGQQVRVSGASASVCPRTGRWNLAE